MLNDFHQDLVTDHHNKDWQKKTNLEVIELTGILCFLFRSPPNDDADDVDNDDLTKAAIKWARHDKF